MSLLLAVLLASLVGSPHCAGMCGAFACFYAAPAAHGRPSRLPHMAYNAGRLASYLLLGALAGAAGAGLDAAGRLAGIARAAAIASGTLMVVWGVARVATLLGARTGAVTGAPEALQARVARALAALRGRPPVARALATGLLTTLLPCGWLYAFVATAAGTGGAAAGALVMAAFWLGTLPVMAAVGLGVQRLGGPLARRLPLASAVAVVAIGLLAIAGKMHAGIALPRIAPSLSAPSAHAAHDAR